MITLSKYRNKNVAVFGLGKTGLSAIECLLNSEAKVYAWDDNDNQVTSTKKVFGECNFIPPKEYRWEEVSAIVLSPGVPLLYPEPHWIVKLARRFKCPITSDIELFLETQGADRKVIGVSGTNGKSTTTSIIGHILKSAGKKVEIGGNLGFPVLSLNPDAEIYVIELSSYQLDLLDDKNLDIFISVLLNITPDHLDRHGCMESYIAAKMKLINMSKVAVIGCDNEITGQIFTDFTGNKIPIAGQKVSNPEINSILLKEGVILDGLDLLDFGEPLHLDKGKINLISNAENIGAAYAACKILKIDKRVIFDGIKSFTGLKHRNEFLGQIKNVKFVNDSKATNAASSEKAILSYLNFYWIVGGISKEGGIEPLRNHFPRIAKAFLIGESSEAFSNTLRNEVEITMCGNLENAFQLAYREALSEESEIVILLSPACASFDQWKNFEDRGEAFCKMYEKAANDSLPVSQQCCQVLIDS